MKREIIFRGKRVDNGKWLFGNIQVPKAPFDKWFMWDENHWQQQVDPKTVGQFTGLTDKNGKKIFDGDTVIHRFKRIWQTEFHTSKVVWNTEFCCYYLNDGTCNHRMRDDIEYEIIEA